MYKDWGLKYFVDKEYYEFIDEMKYVDYIVERILFLEGIFNL